jgi:hypothetical protein
MDDYEDSLRLYNNIKNHPELIDNPSLLKYLLDWAKERVENAKPPALNLRKRAEPTYETPPQKKLRIRNEYDEGRFGGRGDTSRRVCGNEKARKALLKEQGDKCAGLLYKDGYISCSSYPIDCDHMVELRHGGEDSIEYCQMLCYDCHHKKTKLNSKGQFVF